MNNLYNNNDSFRQYVDRYCVKHEVIPEVALTHSMVKSAAEYYEAAEKKKIGVTEVKVGCGGALPGGCDK